MRKVHEARAAYGEAKAQTGNITLSLPIELLESAKELAAKRGQSLNALVREVLQHEVQPAATGKRFVEFARSIPLNPDADPTKWTREDAYRGKRFGDSD